MNKLLTLITILLIPITIISFKKNETNFIMEENKHNVDNIKVNIVKNNEKISIPIEEYIIGVVAGEMPALFEEEALKAQAVASRTYAYYSVIKNKELKSTTDDQVYLTEEEMKNKWNENFEKYYEKIKKCVNNTKGIIMTFNDQPIISYYYAMSNGYTESSLNVFNQDYEYLKVKESIWDKNNENTITISKNQFCNYLKIECENININNIEKDESNRIKNIVINNKKYTGIEIRKILNLRSTDFKIEIEDDIKITTKGYGHGVGMSQYGANYMAKENYNYKEILEYYYEGIKFREI
ncbi:MAG: stage II sporulation protein D [Candidatus Coprovivens sp.]